MTATAYIIAYCLISIAGTAVACLLLRGAKTLGDDQ